MLLLFCSPVCSGSVTIFLPNSLSPLLPSVYFLLVPELSQEIPPPHTHSGPLFAWCPAFQNRSFFCSQWWFQINQLSWALLPQPLMGSCLPKQAQSCPLEGQDLYLPTFRIFITVLRLQPALINLCVCISLWSTSSRMSRVPLLTYHTSQKVVLNALLVHCFQPFLVTLPADTGVVKIPRERHVWQSKSFISWLSDFICFLSILVVCSRHPCHSSDCWPPISFWPISSWPFSFLHTWRDIHP